jgi:peptidoglycan hydrolase-like protein with peptidoglycan-binding domain
MAENWLPQFKYEHIRITSGTGPGTMYEGYAWKFINHSTEGPPGSIAGTVSLFKSRPTSCPHLMIDPMGTQRRIQMIPLNWSACALRGGRNGYQTNRGRAIQMEICGFARESAHWPDSALWIIADTIADVIKAGIPININNMPDDSGLRGTLATENAPQRMTPQAFQMFDGVAAHVRAPFNDHWDCGAINTHKLQDFIKQVLGGSAAVIVPKPPNTPFPEPPNQIQQNYIAKGMVGGQVKFLQELLKGLGYDPGVIDGVFGFATERAVIAFQRAKGLEPDGVVGPATQAAISAAYAPVAPTRPVLPPPSHAASGAPVWPGRYLVMVNPLMSGGDVRTWQQRMSERGWKIGVDGFYGKESFSICKTFQSEKNLTVDGVVGRQTWNAAWTTAVT